MDYEAMAREIAEDTEMPCVNSEKALIAKITQALKKVAEENSISNSPYILERGNITKEDMISYKVLEAQVKKKDARIADWEKRYRELKNWAGQYGNLEKFKELQTKVEELEKENRSWRNVIAAICRDGGHYHQENGTEKTEEFCKKSVLDERSKLSKALESLRWALRAGDFDGIAWDKEDEEGYEKLKLAIKECEGSDE